MPPKLIPAALELPSAADADVPAERSCTRCSKPKPHAAFRRDDAAPDGFSSICRVCELAQEKDRERNIVRRTVEACELCDRPWKDHPRCARCTIGLGEGHLEGPGVLLGDDLPYCGDCAQRQLREQPIRELAA